MDSLEELLSKKKFERIKPYVKTCSTDLSALAKETHLELSFNVMYAFCRKKGYRAYHEAQYILDCRGKTQGIRIMAVVPSPEGCGEDVKRILSKLLAKRCKIKRLTFLGTTNRHKFQMGRYDRRKHQHHSKIKAWCDLEDVLDEFANVALEHIDFLQPPGLVPHEIDVMDLDKIETLKSINILAESAAQDESVNDLILSLPFLEKIQICCGVSFVETNGYPKFLDHLHESHPQIKELHIKGSGELYGSEQIRRRGNQFVKAIKKLTKLERLTIEVEDKNNHQLTEDLVSILPQSNIRDITLRGMGSSDYMLDALYLYISEEEDCRLELFDVPLRGVTNKTRLAELETFLSGSCHGFNQMSTSPDHPHKIHLEERVSFLMKVRRFQPFLNMDATRAVQQFPSYLADLIETSFEPDDVELSVFYTLLRERVDVISIAFSGPQVSM